MRVNLLAPMLLTHRVLPGMLERGRGHVVNMASLAGKSPVPFDAPYSANKAGLIAFTQSLRLEYADAPVGFSAVIPGFVNEGMYVRHQQRGFKAPAFLGESSPEAVARAVLRAIQKDLPEVIVNPRPVRPAIMLGTAFPRTLEEFYKRTGFLDRARRLAESHRDSEPD
jgi:short-subunit dehydrogenase